ncbi:hypothetical protein V8F06_011831 [Rhypophila decipiens]
MLPSLVSLVEQASFSAARRIVRHQNHGSVVTGDSFDRRGCDAWLFERPVLPLRAFSLPLIRYQTIAECQPGSVGSSAVVIVTIYLKACLLGGALSVGRRHRRLGSCLLNGDTACLSSARRIVIVGSMILSAGRHRRCRLGGIIGLKVLLTRGQFSARMHYLFAVVVVVCSRELFGRRRRYCLLGVLLARSYYLLKGIVCSRVSSARRRRCRLFGGIVGSKALLWSARRHRHRPLRCSVIVGLKALLSSTRVHRVCRFRGIVSLKALLLPT